MGQYLGNYEPGSTVQVFTDYETSFGSPVTPGSPQYEILKLNASGSYDIAQAKKDLTVNGSGFYYDIYDTSSDTDGRFLVIYYGSVNDIPYNDFDSFDLVTPSATGTGTTNQSQYYICHLRE